jgi:ankyrin repeat protein
VLRDRDANFEFEWLGTTPVHAAASRGFHRAVAAMCEAVGTGSAGHSVEGADVDLALEETGDTPLHVAAREGHLKVVTCK